jgi:hypothetical protein
VDDGGTDKDNEAIFNDDDDDDVGTGGGGSRGMVRSLEDSEVDLEGVNLSIVDNSITSPKY